MMRSTSRFNWAQTLITITIVFATANAFAENFKRIEKTLQPQVAPTVIQQPQGLKSVKDANDNPVPAAFNHQITTPALEMHMLGLAQNAPQDQNLQPQTVNKLDPIEQLKKDKARTRCQLGEHLDANNTCVKDEIQPVVDDKKSNPLDTIKKDKAKLRCQVNEHLDAVGNCVQ